MANILDLLPGEGAVLSFIREAVEKGKAATETLAALRDSGLGVRTQTFYQAFNYLSGPVQTARKYIDSIGLNALPTINRLPPSLTTQLRNFSYHTVLEGFTAFSAQPVTRHIWVSSNSPLTKQQALDIAGEMATQDTQSGGLESASGRVTDIYQNSGGLVAY
jgi:hypothetical protein